MYTGNLNQNLNPLARSARHGQIRNPMSESRHGKQKSGYAARGNNTNKISPQTHVEELRRVPPCIITQEGGHGHDQTTKKPKCKS